MLFFIILQHELLISLRQSSRIVANFLFFIIFIAIFSLETQTQTSQDTRGFVTISFALLFCQIFTASDFLKKDFEDGSLEQIMLSCENFEIFIVTKMFANWLICCLPIILIMPLIESNFQLLALIFLASIAVNFICCFCGSLSVLGNSAPMIAVIALPLIIPIMLISNISSSGEFFTSFKLLTGLCFFLGATLCFATSKIIKIAVD